MTSRLLLPLALALALLAAGFTGCASSKGRRAAAPGVALADSLSAASRGPGSPGASGAQGASAGVAKSAEATGPRNTDSAPRGADSAPRGADSAANRNPRSAAPQVRAAGAAPSPAPPRAEPLVMENADRMEGFRSRGEYILSGKVRFTHGALRLETERAVWQKDRSLVYAEAGMRIVHRGAVLTSDRGSYDKNQGRATAEGKVRMRDSTGEVEASGHNVTYERFKHLATLTGNPEVRRYYRKEPDSAEAAARAAQGRAYRESRAPGAPAATASRSGEGPSAKPPEIIDTLIIRGQVLTFNDSSGVAAAEGDVRITRKKVLITCRQAEFHDRKDSLYLMGDPQARLDESLVKGLVMRVGMTGEEIKSLLVKGEAQAKSIEPATDTSSSRQSDVRGDSLFMAFRDKAIDSVQVFRNAKGSYFEVDKPDFVNRMSGEYMVLRFDERKIRSANVLGGAKSTYFHLEKKAFKGKNDAEGDTIDFAFKDGKVEEVMVRGRAKGTYFGEPQTRKQVPGGNPLSGEADSLRRQDAPSAPAAPPGAKSQAPPSPSPGTMDGPALKPAAAPAPAGRAGEVPKAPAPRLGEAEGHRRPDIPWRRK